MSDDALGDLGAVHRAALDCLKLGRRYLHALPSHLKALDNDWIALDPREIGRLAELEADWIDREPPEVSELFYWFYRIYKKQLWPTVNRAFDGRAGLDWEQDQALSLIDAACRSIDFLQYNHVASNVAACLDKLRRAAGIFGAVLADRQADALAPRPTLALPATAVRVADPAPAESPDTPTPPPEAPGPGHDPADDRPTARLQVSRKPPRATLDGQDYNLTDGQAAFLDALSRKPGEWVTREDFGRDAGLCHCPRLDRIKGSLPGPLKALVESKPGTGYKLPLA